MNNIVAEWYEDKKNVDEMHNWNLALKEWEQSVIKFFPSGARILDIRFRTRSICPIRFGI